MVEVLATKKEGAPLLKKLAQKGRKGDDRVARLRPEQMDLLKLLGGAGTRNPETGLPEYFLEGMNYGGGTGLGPDPLRLRDSGGSLGTGSQAGALTPTTSGKATSPFSAAAKAQDPLSTTTESSPVDTLGSTPGAPQASPVGPTGVAMGPGLAGLGYGAATGQDISLGYALASLGAAAIGLPATVVGLLGGAVNSANASAAVNAAMNSIASTDVDAAIGPIGQTGLSDTMGGTSGLGISGPGTSTSGVDATSSSNTAAGLSNDTTGGLSGALGGGTDASGGGTGGGAGGAGGAGSGGSGGAGGSGASGGDVAGGVGGSETGSTGTLKDGGRVGKPLRSLLRRRMPRSGIIAGPGKGRADDVPMKVQRGAYVIPADAVAAAGEGNSNAGAQQIGQKLGIPQGSAPAQSGGDKNVRVSGGEFMINDPKIVAQLGGGNLDRGYKMLDDFVKSQRARMIRKLQGAKAPQES